MVLLLQDFDLTAGALAEVNFLTAPPRPVEATTTEDEKQNNDDKYGFHEFSPLSLIFPHAIQSKSIRCAKTCVEGNGS
jgi:hypothetical protein